MLFIIKLLVRINILENIKLQLSLQVPDINRKNCETRLYTNFKSYTISQLLLIAIIVVQG